MRLFAALLIGHEVAAKGNAKSSKVAGSANAPRHANNGVDSAKSFGSGLDSPRKKKENGGPRTRTDERHACMHTPQYWKIHDDDGTEFTCEDMINKKICTAEGTAGEGYDGAFYWFDGDYEIDELVNSNDLHPLNCPQCGCTEAVITPTEYNVCAPDGWTDNAGNTCAHYGVKGWCDPWPQYGTWGFHNMHCPECGCVETRNHEQPQEFFKCAPAGWVDNEGNSCAYHGEKDWCNPWPNYAVDSFWNMHCPECGCVEVEPEKQEYDECAPADWVDTYGDDCTYHDEKGWCNPWPQYAKDGFHNMHCPQCGCVEKAVTPSAQTNGVIEYLWMDPMAIDPGYPGNAEEEWQIDATCDEVRVISTHFVTENDSDFVTIDGRSYSGETTEIDQIVAKSSFTVTFTSDDGWNMDGFSLEWSCPEEPQEPAPVATKHECMPDEGWYVMDYHENSIYCATLAENNICTSDGQMGTGFGNHWDIDSKELIELINYNGFHALQCPECGCVEPTPSEPATQHECLPYPTMYYWYDDNDFPHDCDSFAEKEVCTMEGTKGAGFDTHFGERFDELEEVVEYDDGAHPLNCPRCGCVTLPPGTWAEWGQFSSCSTTCGPGQKSRDRVCETGVEKDLGESNCDETETGAQETQDCEDAICDAGHPCNPNADSWTGSSGMDCAIYESNGYCTADGKYGNQWKEYWGTWETFAKDGFHAGNCPACGCIKEETTGPSPCPSTECWTHDASTNTCAMNTECATLTCGATAFDVTFKSALFNLDDNQSVVTMAGGVISPVWDGSQWTANTPLGENGMTYAVDANTNEVTFAIKFAIVGDDMKTRSDDVQDNIIELGALSVVTTPFGASVDFSCTYSMTIDVASQDYTVTGASVVDTFTGVGSLAAGFTMTLDNGGSPAFLLGSNMPVAITWSVTALSNLQFYLETCTVIHGTTTIKVVKDGCYSATLGVEASTPVTSAEKGFSYQIFKGVGQTDPNQTIECSVTICEVGKCNNPTADNQCPAAGDDATYGYKI